MTHYRGQMFLCNKYRGRESASVVASYFVETRGQTGRLHLHFCCDRSGPEL